MKKTVIKGLSVMLAVVLTLTAAPLSGFVGLELPEWLDFSIISKAAITGSCGENVTWTYDDETCTLTISGSGAMNDFKWVSNWNSYNRPWENFYKDIKVVVIEKGITTIGDYTFYGCKNLTSITIADSVTSIGLYAFYYCSAITCVTIPESVTTIYSGAFSYCTGLTNVTIPDGITEIKDGTFWYCRSLVNVTIPNSVTSIDGYAFRDCSSLKKVNITDISAWCNITFNNGLSNPLCNGADLFLKGEKVTDLIVPNDITKLNDYAFYGCTSLTSVTIPDSVTSIGDNAFSGCKNLLNITIPESVTLIGDYAFNGCKRLLNITIPESVTSIGDYAFYDCNNLTTITIPYGVASIGNYTFYSCNNLSDITIPDSVTSIGSYAFADCNSFISITIPNSVKSIGSYAFYDSGKLETIIIPDNVESIGNYAFQDCWALTSVTISNSVTLIDDYTFSNCDNLTSITIPDNVTSIGKYSFYNCDNLASVVISNSVTQIKTWAFNYCKSLTDVYYTGTKEEWNKILIDTGNDPLLNATIHFNYCEHIFVDGTCTDCGTNKPITQEMSSQIRFNRNADGSYAETFDVRTRAMISDEDFKSLVGATDSEAINNIDKIGFVYTINGENFSAESAQAVAQGEKVSGYVDAPVKYVQDAGEYYMFTCLVSDIPATDRNYTLTAYAYICVNGKWYFSEAPMNADFNALYEKNYPIACEKYGWEV